MEHISLSLLFKAPQILNCAASMLGLIESVDEKLDKLLQGDFNAGVRCLQELAFSSKEQEFLLKEGWKRFHTALTHETLERKALAYVGLAFCQYHLGEKQIAINTLRELTQYECVDKKERLKSTVLETLKTCRGILIPLAPVILTGGLMSLAGKALVANKVFKEGGKLDKVVSITDTPSEEQVRQLKQAARIFLAEETQR